MFFYGRLADLVGNQIQIEPAGDWSIAQVRAQVIARHPQAEAALMDKRARACVSDHLVDEDYVVGATDCVEFLAPVSGG